MPKRHSRLMMTARVAAVAVVSLSAASALSNASAFVEVTRISSPNTLRRSTASTLRYMSLEQVSDFYQNFPLQSAVLTCGVKASFADTIAQVKPQIEENNEKNKQNLEQLSASKESPVLPTTSLLSGQSSINRIDWEARRNFAYVLYGGIFVGAMSHVEYSCVFPFLFGTEKTVAITTAKVFFDNLIAAPIMWLPPAYFIKAWVYSDDDSSTKGILQEGLDKYLTDVRDNDLLKKYWTIWFPAQTISFSFVPDHLRVAFMASISFFWFILFSTVSSQGDNKETASSVATTTTTTTTD